LTGIPASSFFFSKQSRGSFEFNLVSYPSFRWNPWFARIYYKFFIHVIPKTSYTYNVSTSTSGW